MDNRTIEDIQKDIELLGIKGGYDIEQLLTPQDCRRLSYEIERLKKREQECIDHYLVQCKYASEMESKYITANYVINELEKHCETMLSIFEQMTDEQRQEQLDKYKIYDGFLRRIQELKGSESNE